MVASSFITPEWWPNEGLVLTFFEFKKTPFGGHHFDDFKCG
jgi:hypothetical protein